MPVLCLLSARHNLKLNRELIFIIYVVFKYWKSTLGLLRKKRYINKNDTVVIIITIKKVIVVIVIIIIIIIM